MNQAYLNEVKLNQGKSPKNPKILVVMGGTFDPIHVAHITVAKIVGETLQADSVMVIPTGDPPHKKGKRVSNSKDRLNMAILSTCHFHNFYVSSIEIDREGYTYTVETLEEIHRLYPTLEKLYFIVGSDSLFQIPTWKEPERLSDYCTLAAVNRGELAEENVIAANTLFQKYGIEVLHIAVPPMEISSSMIRNKVSRGQSIHEYVDERVERYIKERALYQDE